MWISHIQQGIHQVQKLCYRIESLQHRICIGKGQSQGNSVQVPFGSLCANRCNYILLEKKDILEKTEQHFLLQVWHPSSQAQEENMHICRGNPEQELINTKILSIFLPHRNLHLPDSNLTLGSAKELP